MKLKDNFREPPDEAVVAEIELVEELELAESFGDNAAESVGVEVEESEVGEEAELVGQVASEVDVVEVDASDDGEGGVGRGGGAEDAVVGADIGAVPVGGEVGGVGVDGGGLPGLEGDVGLAESGVGEGEVGGVDFCEGEGEGEGEGEEEE